MGARALIQSGRAAGDAQRSCPPRPPSPSAQSSTSVVVASLHRRRRRLPRPRRPSRRRLPRPPSSSSSELVVSSRLRRRRLRRRLLIEPEAVFLHVLLLSCQAGTRSCRPRAARPRTERAPREHIYQRAPRPDFVLCSHRTQVRDWPALAGGPPVRRPTRRVRHDHRLSQLPARATSSTRPSSAQRPKAKTKCAKCGGAIEIENPLLGAMTLPPGAFAPEAPRPRGPTRSGRTAAPCPRN